MVETDELSEIQEEVEAGSQPLKNVKHEEVCQLVAMLNYAWSAAYREVYCVNTNDAQKNAWVLRGYQGVKDRFAWLQRSRLSDRAAAQRRLLNFHEDVIGTPPSQCDESSPLVQGVKARIVEGRDGKTVERTELLMVSKMDAAKEYARLHGLYPQPEGIGEGGPLDQALATLVRAGRPMEPPPEPVRVIDVEQASAAPGEEETRCGFLAATGQA